jgi:hypothetical protein
MVEGKHFVRVVVQRVLRGRRVLCEKRLLGQLGVAVLLELLLSNL